MSAYARYIGNYSGAETPSASLKGLRVYLAEATRCRSKWRRRHPRASTGPGAGSQSMQSAMAGL